MSSNDSSYPHSLAEGFCKALLHGHRLPLLEQSTEVIEAFLAFDPRTSQCCRSCGPRYHCLMLEALLHTDLEAIFKLYGLSPRLLASIPLFNDTGSVTRPAESVQSSFASVISTNQPHPHSALNVRNSHRCPHRHSSLLLDVACQDSESTVLNFVLQKHPDVDQQREPSRGTQVHPFVKQSSTAGTDVHDVQNDSQKGNDAAERERESSACSRTAVRSINWPHSSSVNVINVCIQKNNPEVLQYLLYREVWLHLMQWDVSVEGRRLSLSRECSCSCSCSYFLHCAALTGSSHLLHLILTSSFGSPCTASFSPTSSLICTESSQGVWPKIQTPFAPGSKSLECPFKKHGRGIQALDLSAASSSLMHPLAASTLAVQRSRATGQAPSFPQRRKRLAAIINEDPNVLLPIYFLGRIFRNGCFSHVYIKVSPLHLACWRCDPSLVQELIDHGASVNLLTQNAWNPNPRYHLSALVVLAIGIPNPHEDRLQKGRSLGLISPRQWSFEQYSNPACQHVVQLVQVLSNAGCHLNTAVVINGQSARALDFLLKPASFMVEMDLSEDHIPDKATVAKFFMCLSWEMLKCGAALSPAYLSLSEWSVCTLEWLAIRNESLQKRFLHLAVFLGLFPSLGTAYFPREGSSQSSTASVCQSEVTGSGDDPNSAAADNGENTEDEQRLRHRQRSRLLRFVSGVLLKSLSASSLMQVIHFLPLSDLRILACFIQELGGQARFTERDRRILNSLNEVVSEPQLRTLLHSCKVVIVRTVSWRPASVLGLPVPPLVQRYLLQPCPDPEVDDPHQHWSPFPIR